MKKQLLTTTLCLALATPTIAQTGRQIETFENGTVKAEYHVDKDGKRHGRYTEFFETGKKKVLTSYRHGELHGAYTAYHPNGNKAVSGRYLRGVREGAFRQFDEQGRLVEEAAFKSGKQHGKRVVYGPKRRARLREHWVDGSLDRACDATGLTTFRGRPAFRETREEIAKTLADLFARVKSLKGKTSKRAGNNISKYAFGRTVEGGPDDALALLKSYRYLCGIPYRDLTLEPDYNKIAVAAAEICNRLGRVDHDPPNPGLSADSYRFARIAAAQCNMHAGPLVSSVHAYLGEIDNVSEDSLVHRRWCLERTMGKVGFGFSGSVSAMYVYDESGNPSEGEPAILFPPRGYVPVTHFSAAWLWSVQLKPRHFEPWKPAEIKVHMSRLDDNYEVAGSLLPLDHQSLNQFREAAPAIVFRPEKLTVTPGLRYCVEIEGLRLKDACWPFAYLVEFFDPSPLLSRLRKPSR